MILRSLHGTHLPGRPRCGYSLRTCHISDAYWWEPTECVGFSRSLQQWWVTGACSLKMQHTTGSWSKCLWQVCMTRRWTICLVFRYNTSDDLTSRISVCDIPLRRWPTRAKLKLVLKFKPTKWSICLQCHSNGHLISMKTSSGLWARRTTYLKNKKKY